MVSSSRKRSQSCVYGFVLGIESLHAKHTLCHGTTCPQPSLCKGMDCSGEYIQLMGQTGVHSLSHLIVVGHTCNPGAQEAKAGGLQVLGQPHESMNLYRKAGMHLNAVKRMTYHEQCLGDCGRGSSKKRQSLLPQVHDCSWCPL